MCDLEETVSIQLLKDSKEIRKAGPWCIVGAHTCGSCVLPHTILTSGNIRGVCRAVLIHKSCGHLGALSLKCQQSWRKICLQPATCLTKLRAKGIQKVVRLTRSHNHGCSPLTLSLQSFRTVSNDSGISEPPGQEGHHTLLLWSQPCTTLRLHP